MANKIKKGDEVVVISGDHKGSKGKILQVIRAKNRVIVEGVNLIKKHERKTKTILKGQLSRGRLRFTTQMSKKRSQPSDPFILPYTS